MSMVVLRSGIRTTSTAISNGNTSKETQVGKKGKPKSNTQLIIFLSLVIDLLGFTVILPLFPALLDYYAKNDSSGFYKYVERHIDAVQAYFGIPKQFHSVLFGGILGSLFSFLQFLSSPVYGALSDFYGRKYIMIICLFGVSASYGLWFVASNFFVFVLARIIGGLSKANVSLSYSIMADVLSPETRSKGMALIGIAFSVGFIVGPVVGVGFNKWQSSGWFAASALYSLCLAVLNIAFFWTFFDESLPKNKRIKTLKTGFSEAYQFISPKSLFNFEPVSQLNSSDRAKLVRLGRVYFIYIFIYSGLEFTITFVTHHVHGFDAMMQGKMFTYLGLLMALVQGGFVRRIKAGSEKNMCLIGLVSLIPAFALIGLMETKAGLFAGLTFYSIGSSLMVPCLTAIASNYGPVTQKGVILGIWRSLGALARAIGPFFACLGFWLMGSGAVYCIGGVSLIIPLIMLKNFN